MREMTFDEYDKLLPLFESDISELEKMYPEVLNKIITEYEGIKSFNDLYFIFKDYTGSNSLIPTINFPKQIESEAIRLIALTFSKNFRDWDHK
jgi:hypothetical protein